MSSFDPYPSDIGQSPGLTVETGSPMPSMPVSPACPWGPWATIGWTVICIVVMFVIQSAVLIVFFVVSSALNPNAKLDALFTNGNVLALSTLASTPVVVGLVALLVSIRRYPIRAYLALIWPPARQVLVAIAGLAVLLVTSDLISYSLGRPLVPPIMVEIYQTAWLPSLLFALIVLAPLGEETLFRGFLYKGIAAFARAPSGQLLLARSPGRCCMSNTIGTASCPSQPWGST